MYRWTTTFNELFPDPRTARMAGKGALVLTLRKLGGAAGFVEAYFLAFDFTCVTSHKASLT